MVICSIAANQGWLDRHFLPAFFLSRSSYVLIESSVRIAAAGCGLVLALVARSRIGTFVAQSPEHALSIAVSIALAFGACEFILRQLHLRAAMEESPQTVPSRRRDQGLGWVFVPSHTSVQRTGGRVVEYAMDSAGYRVRRVDEPVDPALPTILFTGESMMVGEQLTWDETVPALVGTILGLQSANIAVSGFASDQAYLRLQAELPKFRRPVAVVSLFTPDIFDRNLDEDRPHLGPGLVWLPAKSRSRLMMVASFLVPYRNEETIQRGVDTTREVLRATVDLAHSRGASALIVVPQFGPEDPMEHELRRRILDEAGVPYVWVVLDPSWRISVNGHPDARAAHAMAVAIAARLQATSRQ